MREVTILTSLRCCTTMDIFGSSKLTPIGMTKVIQSSGSSYVNILNNVDFKLQADFLAENEVQFELLPLPDKL